MSNEEEGVCQTKLKHCDYPQLSDNTREARYCDEDELISGVDPYSLPWKAQRRRYTMCDPHVDQ